MLKLFIFSLVLLSSLNSFAHHTSAPHATKAQETVIALEQYELCLDEINLQYFDQEKDVIEYDDVSQDDISEMNQECKDNYKANLDLIKKMK